jgi:ketosteroid isomerase-like protein
VRDGFASTQEESVHAHSILHVIPLAVVLALAAPAAAAQDHAAHHTPADSAEVAATVERFHRALAAADSAGALALLTDDVQILESGGVEDRAEYRSHHLGADIEFARAVLSQRTATRVRVHGDVAWATSTSTTQGTFRERAINSASAELMVLVRTPRGWRIAAIHWSSRNRRS